MTANLIKVIRFTKTVDDRTVECTIKQFRDGSAGVFGEEIGISMFEFIDDALERAIALVEDQGYVRHVEG